MTEPVDIMNMYVYMLGARTIGLVLLVSDIIQNNNITIVNTGKLVMRLGMHNSRTV